MPGYLILIITAVILGLIAVDRFSPNAWRKVFVVSIFLLLVLGLRMVLFENKNCWQIYQGLLISKEDITSTQANVIRNKAAMGRPLADKSKPYLALGSSQVGGMFSGSEIFCLSQSNMKFTHYLFFAPFISSIRPQAVILYISEFDLRKDPGLSVMKYLPDDSACLGSILLRRLEREQKKLRQCFYEAGVSLYENSLPEVKYGFILRALLNKLVGLPALDVIKENEGARQRPGRFLPQDKFLALARTVACSDLGTVSPSDENWWGLEEFISRLERKKIKVIIFEGQYHPALMSEPLAVKANHVFRDNLFMILRRHKNAVFIPREEQYLFSADDYYDGNGREWWHVRSASAKKRYIGYLLALLSDRPGQEGLKTARVNSERRGFSMVEGDTAGLSGVLAEKPIK